MASNMPALLAALERGNRTPATARGQRVLVWVVVALLVVVVLVAFLASDAYVLWQAWQSASWSSATLTSNFGFIPLLFVFPSVSVFIALRRTMPRAKLAELAESALLLRELAASSDEQIAPVALLQPAPLSASEISGEPLRIGPLKRPLTANSGNAALFVLLPLLGWFVLLFALLPLLSTPGFPLGFGTTFFSLFPALFVPCVIVALVPSAFGLRRWARQRTFYVSVDTHGLRWRQQGRAGQEVVLPWVAMRGLARITGTAPAEVTTSTSYLMNSTAYLLAGPDVALLWIVSPQASAAEAAASEALLRLTVTNSGKPLRDLSVAARELAQARGSGARPWYAPAYVGQSGAPPSLAELNRLMQQAQKPRRTGMWVMVSLATILLLLLAVLPYGASAWLQNYQSQYFATLPARLRAQHPIYADSLKEFDDEWPVGKPSATTCGYRFLAGTAYEVYGNTIGNTCQAYPDLTYGDAAVEVTAAESGKLTANLTDGVGLLLRGNADDSNFVAFFVLSSGEWDLWHYQYIDANPADNWSTLASGHSSAVNAAFGATNRLLVVMRGQVFLLFVNDHLVNAYNTQYDDLPSTGHVGLYLNESSITGMFVNFAVYLVQPTSSFWYV